jgi:hypothetical protein
MRTAERKLDHKWLNGYVKAWKHLVASNLSFTEKCEAIKHFTLKLKQQIQFEMEVDPTVQLGHEKYGPIALIGHINKDLEQKVRLYYGFDNDYDLAISALGRGLDKQEELDTVKAKMARLNERGFDKATEWFMRIIAQLKAQMAGNKIKEQAGIKVPHRDIEPNFSIHGCKFKAIDDEVDIHTVQCLIQDSYKAYQLLKDKSLTKVWSGTVFYGKHGYRNDIGGEYDIKADTIELWQPFQANMVLLHEFGHRYWYKFMTSKKRALFNGLVKIENTQHSRDYEQSEHSDEYGHPYPKPVIPVSEYGKTRIEEAFAEVFLHYCQNRDMTRDQLESFKAVL